MKLKSFLQDDGTVTTLSEITRLIDWAECDEFLGLFAYATQSGVSAFDLEVGERFWEDVHSRWLFGIDYGRTEPSALERILEQSNADVRIFDGAWVVDRNGFVPRQIFHTKAAFGANKTAEKYGLVVGSGNFSASGLKKNIEAGASLQATSAVEFRKTMQVFSRRAEELWEQSAPATDVLEKYSAQWKKSALKLSEEEGDVFEIPVTHFWIEAGYVTKNRGPDRPGNQIDFPRGMSRYFGFNPPSDLPRNSVIGSVTFVPPFGGRVENNLRLGNNLMEKISLPIPETHGFDIYDGKVLVFERVGGEHKMWALESEDFRTAFGDRIAGVRTMNSGRRYGHILEHE